MDCLRCREALSAAADGEATAIERAAARAHAQHCADCSAFADDVTGLARTVRVTPATPVPDLTASIIDRHAGRRSRARAVLRAVLVVAAVVSFLVAWPALVDGGRAHAGHGVQHLGTFDLALAAGFAWVAWRPERARAGFLPIGTVLVSACVTLTAIDVTSGHGETLRLLSHGAAVVGLAAAWLLGTRRPARRPRPLSLAA